MWIQLCRCSQKTSGLVIIPKQKDFTIEPNDLIVKVDQQKLFLHKYFWTKSKVEWQFLWYYLGRCPWRMELKAMRWKKYCYQNKSNHSNTRKNIPQNVYAFHIPWNNRVSAQVLSLLHQIISKYVLLWKKGFRWSNRGTGGLLVKNR
jgi:hypothetical protein